MSFADKILIGIVLYLFVGIIITTGIAIAKRKKRKTTPVEEQRKLLRKWFLGWLPILLFHFFNQCGQLGRFPR
ncbi:MAG: hypothetical protein COU47_03480 [Candidatus Niyogibacteria bacterium CG10_big_fil_rev_8_21_14_0_10_46_36]|uniref:Uncharacterized protein n=1 Tax=Candidatus Niyogibacteria bacterium CG10_big_fil_rev_8_21_14_0_10_46_36 TaxID=1974726 RepID=A0A2H0TF12_9BACT|nr:MAG: hypothetical protein COU47_03480 [Candidatus Niyogibacteria bacterium CG10_big_fil_rev_8_21_14_0_10_46_36]